MTDGIERQIIASLPRDLVIDLYDVAVSRAREAHLLVHERTDLDGPSARGLEGQARYRLMEKGFSDACILHGGVPLEGDIMPGTNLRVFQPFMRFGGAAPGVLLGLASMPSPGELPSKNRSRSAGVTLNVRWTPTLPLDDASAEAAPKDGDLFALLLFARDPHRAGSVAEVAVGVIDSGYGRFLYYKPLETFLAGYATPDGTGADRGTTPPPVDGLVKLKKTRKAFKPPEAPDPGDAADAGE